MLHHQAAEYKQHPKYRKDFIDLAIHYMNMEIKSWTILDLSELWN